MEKLSDQEKWEAVKQCDVSYDGIFFYAVKSTKIYCRPSCKSKLPKRKNVCYFATSQATQKAGYRPCKRCRSDLIDYEPMKEIAREIKKKLKKSYSDRFQMEEQLKNVGLSHHRMNIIFNEYYHMTMTEYVNRLKLKEAKVANIY